METYVRKVVALPPGTSVRDVSTAVTEVCRRHESLRTRFVETSAGPRQIVGPVPDLTDLECAEIPGADRARATRLADDLARRWFDLAVEYGCRFVVVLDHGRPAHLVIVADHIVADGYGVDRVGDEILVELGALPSAEVADWAPDVPQPRELAIQQYSPEQSRTQDAVLDRWRGLLAAVPDDIFPADRAAAAVPGRIEAVLRSAQARTSVAAVSAAAGISPHSVILALTRIATAAVTGVPNPLLTLQASNRFHRRWRHLVTSMNQWAPLFVPASGPATTFARFAGRVHLAALQAYRHGSYDVDVVNRLIEQDRGRPPAFDNFFNFLGHALTPGSGPGPASYEPGEVARTTPLRMVGPRLDIKVRNTADLQIVIRCDPRLLPEPGLHNLLRWYDEQLYRLATGADSRVDEVAGRCAAAVAG